MRKFLLGLFVLFATAVSAETIKGSVMDTKGAPMPFVTVSVLTQDSTLITGAISDPLIVAKALDRMKI